MTDTEKKSLYRELQLRLEFHPLVDTYDGQHHVIGLYEDQTGNYRVFTDCDEFGKHSDFPIESIKLFLRPVATMADEEMDRLFDILNVDLDGQDETNEWIKINDVTGIKLFTERGQWIEDIQESIDYLLSRGIDYRMEGVNHSGIILVEDFDTLNRFHYDYNCLD